MRAARVWPLLVALASCASGGGPSSDEREPISSAASPDLSTDLSAHQFVAVKVLTPEIKDASERWLKEFYKSPVGTEQRVVVDGKPLLFILQWHYHPPGYVGAPSGKHKGVTVFEEQ